MSEQAVQKQQFAVTVLEPDDAKGTLVFKFVPKEALGENVATANSKRAPEFIAIVHHEADALTIGWDQTSDSPGAEREDLEAEIAALMSDRANWMERVHSLVDRVEGWAKEMGWSTRRIEKKLDDARIGNHTVPALLMQEEICRVLLEPVGRSAPGAAGVVDLYLMPAYDDIARLYYDKGWWNIHGASVAKSSEEGDMPLTKETLAKILEEMRQHAA